MKLQGFKQANGLHTHTIKGFTLIEMVITIMIIAIIASLAIPSYTGYVRRGKLAVGTEALISFRGLMEQGYQARRSYQDDGGNCLIDDFTDDYFAHTCASGSDTTFLWTSTSRGSVGLGTAGDYAYTINQDGLKCTLKSEGTALDAYCGPGKDWKLRN